jgi:peptidoglycan/xylan/chitin deacetylase (PgdA/CDA1 family)
LTDRNLDTVDVGDPREIHRMVAHSGLDLPYLKDLWNSRALIRVLIMRDLTVRYKQTLFGPAWVLLQPLLTVLVYSLLFGYSDEPIIHDTWNVLSGSAPGSRRAAYVEIMPAVKALAPSARERVLNELRRTCGVDLAGEPDARPMTPQDVAEVDRRGIIEVGAHTVEHPQLALLDPMQQDDEIAKSARTVAQWTGHAPALFAYPYGSNADYDSNSVKAVKRAGFRAACSNFPGLVNATTSVFELPRMLVRNVAAQELESLIDGEFAAEVAKR